MSSTQRESRATTQTEGTPPSFVVGLWGVRYQVKDVARSVAFYTKDLGFKLDRQNLPAFAQVSLGHLKLILSGPGASGSRLMPDGRRQEPGGWNLIVLEVRDLPARITELKKREDCSFATRWKQVRAGNKSNWRIPTAIRSSCSSPGANRRRHCHTPALPFTL